MLREALNRGIRPAQNAGVGGGGVLCVVVGLVRITADGFELEIEAVDLGQDLCFRGLCGEVVQVIEVVRMARGGA